MLARHGCPYSVNQMNLSVNISGFGEMLTQGYSASAEELEEIARAPLDELLDTATSIRRRFIPARIELCAIMNAKSGACGENCAYCAQSSHHATGALEYPLIAAEAAMNQARHNGERGVSRFSLVTSGARLSDSEFASITQLYDSTASVSGITLCASLGALNASRAQALKRCGVSFYHHNLETSRRFFPRICTTHSYDSRLESIRAAQNAGLAICSGGIIGMGETMEDRIAMALELRALGVKSIPINILNPVPGTPLAGALPLAEDAILRTVALFRFANPDADIRLAGGRSLLRDRGERALAGPASGMMTGDLLTTAGTGIADDVAMIRRLGLTNAVDI
jgi:biotin synthase